MKENVERKSVRKITVLTSQSNNYHKFVFESYRFLALCLALLHIVKFLLNLAQALVKYLLWISSNKKGNDITWSSKRKKNTWKNKMKQNGQMKKQEKMHKFLWLLFPCDFELFAHPLTLCVINYGLIFFLHFSKKTIYFFLGKGALLISYQKNTSIITLRYSFLPLSFEILDKTCINTIQL